MPYQIQDPQDPAREGDGMESAEGNIFTPYTKTMMSIMPSHQEGSRIRPW
jgi:hypothetical protein